MTRIKNILVPVDFSDASKQALRYACELADTFEASLHVLHAAENPFGPSGYTEFYPFRKSSSIRLRRKRENSSRRD